jgi:hypothetical protein
VSRGRKILLLGKSEGMAEPRRGHQPLMAARLAMGRDGWLGVFRQQRCLVHAQAHQSKMLWEVLKRLSTVRPIAS